VLPLVCASEGIAEHKKVGEVRSFADFVGDFRRRLSEKNRTEGRYPN
jgi:hypothetical protein